MSRELFEGAYRKFWDLVEAADGPRYLCNAYDLCDRIGKAEWRIPFVGFMVDGELRESINELNSWCQYLANLKIWLALLADYDEEDSWSLRLHFVEPVVRNCMLQPSATRDRFGQVVTNGVHQLNLTVDTNYKDALDQDSLGSGKFLSRKKVELQLERLVNRWPVSNRLITALKRLDSDIYRQKTFDYRNEASHFIAPRLEVGEVQFVTRRIVPFSEMVKQLDGTFELLERADKHCVSYGFGGIRPLTLEEIIEINSKEYDSAIAVLTAYSDLLEEALPQIGKSK